MEHQRNQASMCEYCLKWKILHLQKEVFKGDLFAKACAGKTVVVLLGISGVGKSVLHNYLIGHCFEELTPDEMKSMRIMNPGVRPVKLATTTPIKGTSPIGHGRPSTTSMPIIGMVDDLIICDCPGFYDNRDNFLRLANAAHIRNIFHYAKSVQIVCVFDYHHIADARQKDLDETGSILDGFFGGEEESKKLKHENVFIAVSKVPKGEQMYVNEDLHDKLKTSKSPAIQRAASNRVLLFDPLNRRKESFMVGPILPRHQLLTILRTAKKVSISAHFSVTDSEEKTIRQIGTFTKSGINECLKEKEVNYREAAEYFKTLASLDFYKHPEVENAIEESRRKLEMHLNKMTDEAQKLADECKWRMVTEAFQDMYDFAKLIDDRNGTYVKKLIDLEKKLRKSITVKEIKIGLSTLSGAVTVGRLITIAATSQALLPLEIAEASSLIGGGVAVTSVVSVAAYRLFNSFQRRIKKSVSSTRRNQETSTCCCHLADAENEQQPISSNNDTDVQPPAEAPPEESTHLVITLRNRRSRSLPSVHHDEHAVLWTTHGMYEDESQSIVGTPSVPVSPISEWD